MEWYHRSIHVRRLFYKAIITTAMLLLRWQVFNFFTPPQHNPFTPLDLTIKPGLVTGYELESLGADKSACFALLDEAGVTYARIDKTSDNAECGIADGLMLDQSLTPYAGTITTSCRLAATLHMWERHVVLPAAQEIFGRGVERIETMGSYQCRGVNNARTGRWNEHANSEAIDIGGFTLVDGTRVILEGAFNAQTREEEFLRRVRDKAFGLVSTRLTPVHNALH